MQKYKYTAVDANNKKYRGYYVANNTDDLRRQLANSGLYLVKQTLAEGTGLNRAISLTGKLPIKDLTVFCRQFSIMITAGIPIVECINSLKQQKFKEETRQSLNKLYDDLNSGMLLSEAMRKQKKAYPNFFISMIYVGENSGTLDMILKHLADYYENDQATRKKLSSALIYPIILFILAIGVVSLMVFYVIPKFQESLAKMNVPMPTITNVIFNFSNWMIDHALVIGIVIASIILVLFVFGRFKFGRYVYDTIKYKFFLTRTVYMNITTSRFARSLGLLLTGGTNMMNALSMVEGILGNKYAEKKFHQVIVDIENGSNITTALEKSHLFRKMLIQMVDVGEKSGALDEVLLRSCEFFDQEVQASINKLTSLIQPVILIFLAVAILLMFLGIYSPILSIMDNLSGVQAYNG